MKILLIWNETGISSRVFLICNPSNNDLKLLNETNNRYIYVDISSENQSVKKIHDYISKSEEFCITKGDVNNCKWAGCEITIKHNQPVLNESINRVYICGIYN